MTNRYKFTIAYNGEKYAGWQRQKDVPSVQQALEEALAKFYPYDQTPQLTAAGRTDAGVHALGQVTHVDLDEFTKPMTPFEIAKGINAHLRPAPISVIHAEIVDDEFHARFGAINKLYRYRILVRPAPPVEERGFVWHMRRPPAETMNIKAMQDGAKHLIGHHDFTTFRDSQCQAKTPMRTLDRLDITSEDNGIYGQMITIEAEGKSFIHHQVRNMVGTLALVGEGKWSPADIKAALEACDRTKGGPTAPAEGLTLMRIDY